MVQQVGKLYNNRSKFVENVFQKIERITKRMVVSLMKEDREFLRKQLLKMKNYRKIGVVSSSTIKLLETLKPYGVGKITGAGGKKWFRISLILCHGKNKAEKYFQKKYFLFNI